MSIMHAVPKWSQFYMLWSVRKRYTLEVEFRSVINRPRDSTVVAQDRGVEIPDEHFHQNRRIFVHPRSVVGAEGNNRHIGAESIRRSYLRGYEP